MKRRLFCLFLILLLSTGWGAAVAAPDLTLQDSSLYSESWAKAYAEILREREAGIEAYQNYMTDITYSPFCRSVGITDLTGDGVPELLFMDLLTEPDYGFSVGRLWIYTSDWKGVHCMLTLQPEIDDLLYSRYYLNSKGQLTVYLSDMEMSFILQLSQAADGTFKAENTLIEEADFSGEGPDFYYQNGKKITKKKYQTLTAKIKAGQGTMIGSLQVDQEGYGFTHTLAEALDALAAADAGDAETDESPSGGRLPALVFSLGTFEAGQKFAVYSAPSAKSWRGAKGKAAITSGSEIFVAGTADGWILILYELSSGVIRVGYIDAAQISGTYSSSEALSFSNTQMKLTKSAALTDDPIRRKTDITKLKKGTAVTCLAEYQGMIYVEATVSGKTARGFIAPNALDWTD